MTTPRESATRVVGRSREAFKAALKRRDAAICKQIYDEFALSEGWAEKVVADLKEFGILLAERKELTSRTKPLIELCQQWAASWSEEVAAEFFRHLEQARLFSTLFQELDSIRETKLGGLNPAKQAWGVIKSAYSQMAEADREISERMDKDLKTPIAVSALGVDGPTGFVNGDSIHVGLVDAVGATLTMLAYSQKWFGEGGIVRFPDELSVSEDENTLAEQHIYLAVYWDQLMTAWERSRLFGVEVQSQKDDRGVVIYSADPVEMEFIDNVALSRLTEMHGEQLIHLQLFDGKTFQFPRPIKDQVLKLPPEEFISKEEMVSFGMFADSFHLPIGDQTALVHGLPLAVWLRGYSVISHLCDAVDISDILRIGLEDFRRALIQNGLSAAYAELFIDRVSFQRNSKDLFDTPLLRTKGEDSYLFNLASQSAISVTVILSRLQSLSRTIGQPHEFGQKGQLFEERVHQLFASQGILARTFSYNGGQCDLAAVVDDFVFVFECKNYNLPLGRLTPLYYFQQGLNQARQQAERIARDLNENPEVLASQFDDSVRGKQIVPIVLFSLPWAMDTTEGACVFDYWGLERLLVEKHASLNLVSRVGATVQKVALWEKDKPTAAEFIRHLRSPLQIKTPRAELGCRRTPLLPATDLLFHLPTIVSQPLSEAERMKIFRESGRPVVGMIEEVLAPKNKSIGRNAPCPCGSGRKFKKCCVPRTGIALPFARVSFE